MNRNNAPIRCPFCQSEKWDNVDIPEHPITFNGKVNWLTLEERFECTECSETWTRRYAFNNEEESE